MIENLPAKTFNFGETDYILYYDIDSDSFEYNFFKDSKPKKMISELNLYKSYFSKNKNIINFINKYLDDFGQWIKVKEKVIKSDNHRKVKINAHVFTKKIIYHFHKNSHETFTEYLRKQSVDEILKRKNDGYSYSRELVETIFGYSFKVYYFEIKKSFLSYIIQNRKNLDKIFNKKIYYFSPTHSFRKIYLTESEYYKNILRSKTLYHYKNGKRVNGVYGVKEYDYYDDFLLELKKFFESVNISNDNDIDGYLTNEARKYMTMDSDKELKRLQEVVRK